MSTTSAAPTANSSGFQIHIDDALRCVTVRGELDMATTPLMMDAAATLQSARPGKFTLDLLAVTFIDAGALGALVRLRELQRAQAEVLQILGSPRVACVAALAGLGSIITSDEPSATRGPAYARVHAPKSRST
jgi:anti-anti-sigma factor